MSDPIPSLSCGTCLFFAWAGKSDGFCVRNPPLILHRFPYWRESRYDDSGTREIEDMGHGDEEICGSLLTGYWPYVSRHDWCGEYTVKVPQ